MFCGVKEMGEEEIFDVMWFWVNGFDYCWRDSMVEWREKENVNLLECYFW